MGAQTRESLAEDITGSTRGMTAQSRFKYRNKNGNMKWDAKGMRSLDANANANPNDLKLTTPAINLPSQRPERILIVDQSRFYAALRTYEVEDRSISARRAVGMARAQERRNRKAKEEGEKDGGGVFQQKYLPLDPYGSQIMDTKLYQRVVKRELALREEIGWGADEEKLRDEVARARLLIKDSLDREVGLFDRDEAGEAEKNVDRHHEEWPLNLNGWSASGRDLQVVLRWEDGLAVEENYVDKFAEAVHMFLVTLRRKFSCFLLHFLCSFPRVTKSNNSIGIRTSNDETTHPETIHTVVILTDHTDGDLLTRAIIQALGRDVKIVGGNLMSMTLAAEGAAKLGLRRLESWEEVMRQERLMEFLDSGEGQW